MFIIIEMWGVYISKGIIAYEVVKFDLFARPVLKLSISSNQYCFVTGVRVPYSKSQYI